MEEIVNQMTPESASVAVPDKKGQAIASFVLGLSSILGLVVPFIGIPASIVGIIMGIIGRKSSKKWMAITGLILSIVFLVVSVVVIILAVIVAMNTINELGGLEGLQGFE